MSTFNDAVERLEATDQATWLGKLAWFSVTESTFPHATLEQQLTAQGLDAWCPRPPRDDDVFRRVFFNGQRKTHDLGDGIRENLLVRQMKREAGVIVKRIVIETVDAKGNKLSFDPEGVEVKFSGGGIRMRRRSDHGGAYALGNKLKAEYERERGCVNANAVREIIRRVFDSCRSTVVRSGGGVYFVPEKYVDRLVALESASKHLPGTLVHSLPLIDDEKQRTNLRECYEAEVVGECDRLIAEITEITKAGAEITEARGDGYLQTLKTNRAKLAEYQELLSDNIEDAGLRLAVLEKKIVQVIRDHTKE